MRTFSQQQPPVIVTASRASDRPQPITFSTLPAKVHSFPEAGRGGDREAEGLGIRAHDKHQEAEIRWWRDGVPVAEGETEVKRDEVGE